MQYIIIVILLVLLDQGTKLGMYNYEKGIEGQSIPIIKDFFHLTYVENRGAIFGFAQGKIHIFTILSTLLIAYILYTEWNNIKNYSKLAKIGVCFIVSGAIGNMLDRIFRGYVIDMIDFRGIWVFVFNVADMYIHIGIYLLIINWFLNRRKRRE